MRHSPRQVAATSIVSLALLLLAGCSSQPVTSLNATVPFRIEVYSGPNVNYPAIGYLETNAQVTLTGRSGDTWVAFAYTGQTGWVQDFFLEIDGNPQQLPEIIFQIATSAPIETPSAYTATPELWRSELKQYIEDRFRNTAAEISDDVIVEVGYDMGEYINFHIRMDSYQKPGAVEAVPKWNDGDRTRSLLTATYEAVHSEVVPKEYRFSEVGFYFYSTMPDDWNTDILKRLAYYCRFFWDEVEEAAQLTKPRGDFSSTMDNIDVFWNLFFQSNRCVINRLYDGG